MTKELRESLEKYLADNWIALISREERIILSFIEHEIIEAERRARMEWKREWNNELIGKLCVAMPDWATSFLGHKL